MLHNNTIIWWLEDDWTIINPYNFIPLLYLLNNNGKNAINITNNAPLCSFRGGPIMNHHFFTTYFDIHKKLSDNKDPERHVGKNIRYNETVSVYKEDIYIICVHIMSLKDSPYSMDPSCWWWYKKKFIDTKFSPDKKIKYILVLIENPESNELYYKINEDYSNLNIENKDNIDLELNKCSIKDFNNLIENSSLNYITIVPHIFEDIGRIFNTKHNIIKIL